MLSKILILLTFCTFCVSANQAVIKVSVETDIYNYVQEILANKPAFDVTDFTGSNSQRSVVEFILVQQALALGGLQLEFSFITGNYDARNPKLLQDGLLLINFDTMWLSQAAEYEKDVYISDAVIEKGEYWAGIYTSIENKERISVKNIEDFKKLTVISNKNWTVDWHTLNKIQPKELKHEEEWISMVKLVSLGWVDVMLAPFTKSTKSTPFVYQGTDYKIVAFDGVKVALNDSRHFVVSRNHPMGKVTFEALQKGLKILKEQGIIKKAYRQSGFFNNKVKNWHVINESLLSK